MTTARKDGTKNFCVKLARSLATGPLAAAHTAAGIACRPADVTAFCFRRLREGYDATTIQAHYLAALKAVAARPPRRRYAGAVEIVAFNSLLGIAKPTA